MGTFDTIVIASRRFQTKALGAGMSELFPGDRVRVAYKSQSEEEYELNYTHPYRDLPSSYTVLAIVELDGEEVAVAIIDGALTGIVDAPLPSHFDRQGRSIGPSRHTPHIAASPEWQRVRAEAAEARRRRHTNNGEQS